MFLIPPQSQIGQQEYSYTEKFNPDINITQDKNLKLSCKLGNNNLQFLKHPKDGKIYNKIDYNNFYKDFKQDANTKDSYKKYLTNNIINTQPQTETQIEIPIPIPMPSNTNSHYDNNTITSTHNTQQHNNPYLHINTNTLSIYNNAERYKEFINKSFNNTHVIPLHTSGINNINILYDDKYNDKYNNNTFNYKRFALQDTQTSNQIYETQNNNLLYKNDITQETQQLQKKYINDITQRNIDLYSSVFEDMHILGFQINN